MSEIGTTDLPKMLELRVFLAGFCARLAARRITQSQIARMEALLRSPGDRLSGNNRTLLSIDRAFQCLLYEAADNRYLADRLESLYDLSSGNWPLIQSRIEGDDCTIERLSRLLDALREGDEVEAETLMREHIGGSQESIKATD